MAPELGLLSPGKVEQFSVFSKHLRYFSQSVHTPFFVWNTVKIEEERENPKLFTILR